MTLAGINGASGQMGQALLETAQDREDLEVVFGVTPGGDSAVTGRDIPVYDPTERQAAIETHEPDVVVDFSVPEATPPLAETAIETDVALVVGTTGFDDQQLGALRETSGHVPVLRATNFARGIQALLAALDAALAVLPEYDVELLETHHNRKRDAPSGTASSILETIADHREFETVAGRAGTQPRDDGEVGVHVRRAGDVRGEHEILLAGNDEVVTLRHRAEDRGVFAAGALDAAAWVSDRSPGWYSMEDVTSEPTASASEEGR